MISVTYELADLCRDAPVRVSESRGNVTFELHRGLFVPEGVAALNSAVEMLLAGGQWFQLWKGEVVSVHSPQIRGWDGGVHRGPLVDQAARPDNG